LENVVVIYFFGQPVAQKHITRYYDSDILTYTRDSTHHIQTTVGLLQFT